MSATKTSQLMLGLGEMPDIPERAEGYEEKPLPKWLSERATPLERSRAVSGLHPCNGVAMTGRGKCGTCIDWRPRIRGAHRGVCLHATNERGNGNRPCGRNWPACHLYKSVNDE